MKILVFSTGTNSRYRYFAALNQQVGTEVGLITASDLRRGLPRFWPWPTAADLDAINRYDRCYLNHRHPRGGLGYLFSNVRMALSGWWHLACARRLLSRMDVDLLLVWNGEKAVNRAMVMAARENNIPVGFMEEGPLPGTTVLDPQGVHSQAVLPRDPAFYVQAGQNGKTVEATGIPHQPIWMMPWQPRSDSRLLTASPWIHSMAHAWQELLRARHRANCDDITLILERPSEGEAMPAGVEGQPGVQILDHADFMGRLPEASALFTVNSDLAMQAIGQGVRVVLMGDAFYEVPGLVLEAGGPESLVHAMKRLPVWSADPALVQGYLRYLQEDYLLPGDWRNPDINHWQAVITRLHKLARCEPIL